MFIFVYNNIINYFIQYLAHQTSAKVGQRIIELIFQWSMDFKELPKIFEAYQMLKVQKIVLDDPVHVLKVSIFFQKILFQY